MRISYWSADVCSSDLITTVARGRCTSEPAPTLSAMGTNPREATSAVIRTGRRRVSAPCRMDSSKSSPRIRRSRMKESITTPLRTATRSEEHTSELQSLMRISYAVYCLKKKINHERDKLQRQIDHS